MNAMAKTRELAKSTRLHNIRYLDYKRRPGARGAFVHTVELTFDTGEIVELTKQELAMLRDVEFKLRDAPP